MATGQSSVLLALAIFARATGAPMADPAKGVSGLLLDVTHDSNAAGPYEVHWYEQWGGGRGEPLGRGRWHGRELVRALTLAIDAAEQLPRYVREGV